MWHTHVPWGDTDVEAWGHGPHVASHELHEHGAFDRAGLVALLDRVPREIVHPYTMGTDPERTEQWRRGEVTDLPGEVLLDTVERGRLWLNVVGVGEHDAVMRELTEDLYAQVSALVPGFAPRSVRTTLLISSPTAQVYYHADNQPNALWHLRGTKRVHVYPRSERYVTAEQLEAISAGASDEQLPYRAGLDEDAWSAILEPGQVAWWPQGSPHRVVNLDGLNVSLSTEHRTAASTRREQVLAANHHLRARVGRPLAGRRLSHAEHGPAPAAKVALGRVARRVAPVRPAGPRPSFAVDPSADDGVRVLR